jgi:plasmid replication initiation protein
MNIESRLKNAENQAASKVSAIDPPSKDSLAAVHKLYEEYLFADKMPDNPRMAAYFTLPLEEKRKAEQSALERALREYAATPEGKAELAAWGKARKQAAKFAG